MPRRPQPNWNEQRQCFQFNWNGKRYRVKTEQEAEDLIETLIAQSEKPSSVDPSLPSIVNAFLDWVEAEQSYETYEWYRRPLLSLCKRLGPRIKVSQLKAHHVEEWLAKEYRKRIRDKKKLSENSVRHPKRAVMRCLNWAAKKDYIPSNPLHGKITVGDYTGTPDVISQEQWDDLMEAIKCDDFKDYLLFQRLTGCRPQEARAVQHRHVVQGTKPHILFSAKESKGKKYPRKILLSQAAWQLVQKRMAKHRNGHLFRRADGEPWNANTVKQRFDRLEEKLGFRVKQKSLRHTWTTEFLKNGGGVSAAAAILGHRNATMVLKNYSHVINETEHLYEELEKRGPEL